MLLKTQLFFTDLGAPLFSQARFEEKGEVANPASKDRLSIQNRGFRS